MVIVSIKLSMVSGQLVDLVAPCSTKGRAVGLVGFCAKLVVSGFVSNEALAAVLQGEGVKLTLDGKFFASIN